MLIGFTYQGTKVDHLHGPSQWMLRNSSYPQVYSHSKKKSFKKNQYFYAAFLAKLSCKIQYSRHCYKMNFKIIIMIIIMIAIMIKCEMRNKFQSLQTRWVTHYLNRTTDSPKCRMCEKTDENVSHIVSECNELAQNEYKKLRQDKVVALLHELWCKTSGFETHEKYYEHFIEKEMRELEND